MFVVLQGLPVRTQAKGEKESYSAFSFGLSAFSSNQELISISFAMTIGTLMYFFSI